MYIGPWQEYKLARLLSGRQQTLSRAGSRVAYSAAWSDRTFGSSSASSSTDVSARSAPPISRPAPLTAVVDHYLRHFDSRQGGGDGGTGALRFREGGGPRRLSSRNGDFPEDEKDDSRPVGRSARGRKDAKPKDVVGKRKARIEHMRQLYQLGGDGEDFRAGDTGGAASSSGAPAGNSGGVLPRNTRDASSSGAPVNDSGGALHRNTLAKEEPRTAALGNRPGLVAQDPNIGAPCRAVQELSSSDQPPLLQKGAPDRLHQGVSSDRTNGKVDGHLLNVLQEENQINPWDGSMEDDLEGDDELIRWSKNLRPEDVGSPSCTASSGFR